MTIKHFVDASGNYLGAYEGEAPTGGVEVNTAPEAASQTWDGSSWSVIPLTSDDLKLQGIEFEGVMCSATAEDMWGLNATQSWIEAGNSTNFKFQNGNILTLTPSNVVAFQTTWMPFRASFF